MFPTKAVEKIKTHFMFNSFFPENRAVYERLWKKFGAAKEATNCNINWRMRFACWISKATRAHMTTPSRTYTHTHTCARAHTYTHTHTHTHPHRICNIYCFSTATMVTRKRLDFTLYVHFPSCFFYVSYKRMYTKLCLSRVL